MEVQMKSRPIILFGVFFLMLVVAAQAQIPRTLSYQGVLTDSLGNPQPDGTYTFTFRLYESISGGSAIWSEQKTLQVSRGLFHTVLGDQVVISPSVAFDRPYWLSIQLASSPELLPRIPLTASAYSIASIRSDTARFALTAPQQGFVDSARIAGTVPNNAVTTAKIQDGAVTGAKIGTGHVVKRLNGISDAITLTAQGGATITSNNDTIIINAGSGGGGTGVQGVQNTNNTLDIINPNGPTVTVNVKNSGISSTQLADNSVTSAKILNGTIAFADIGQNGAASGHVMKWSGAAWAAAADENGAGVFLPLAGGTLSGPITSTGAPSITMGKANFGSGNTNAGTHAFVAGQNNSAAGVVSSVAGGSGNSASIDFASIGGGIGNTASGLSSRVGGGDGNTASGTVATVGGGLGNVASESYAVAGGGSYNQATGVGSTVGGGASNKARGLYSVVSGGGGANLSDSNAASGDYSTIAGGRRNRASFSSFIGGGFSNEANASYAAIGGGINNEANASLAAIAGGASNVASGSYSVVSGGLGNTASGAYAVVAGGFQNYARGDFSFVGGGGGGQPNDTNSALGQYSAIPGGRRNRASGNYSFAAGLRANADHDGSFVWGDATGPDVVSDTANQFKVRASNGMNLTSNAGQAKQIRIGDYYRDNAIVAWGNINGDGTFGATFGVRSVIHESVGFYTINVYVSVATANTLIPTASAEVDGMPNSAASTRFIYIDQVNTTSFNVYITNGNYTATDNEFTFIVTGR